MEFLGNNLKDWDRWHSRSGTAPLDPVLDEHCCNDEDFYGDLYDTVKDRAREDTI